jgi:hypothetical protein
MARGREDKGLHTFVLSFKIQAMDIPILPLSIYLVSGAIEYNGIRGENTTLIQFDHGKQQWQLLFAPQQTGEYILWIFACHQSERLSTLSSIVQLHLQVTKLRRPMKFPLIYNKFISNRYQIYQPLYGILKRDAIVPIHCLIPEATTVKLQVDSKWIDTTGYDDPVFSTKTPVGSIEMTVYAKYGQKTDYDRLIRYSVQ